MSRHLRWVVHFYPISVDYLNVKMSLAWNVVTAWTEGGAFTRWLQIKRTWALWESSTELRGRVETPWSEWPVEQEPGYWESRMLAANYGNLGWLSLASIPCQVENLDVLDQLLEAPLFENLVWGIQYLLFRVNVQLLESRWLRQFLLATRSQHDMLAHEFDESSSGASIAIQFLYSCVVLDSTSRGIQDDIDSPSLMPRIKDLSPLESLMHI